MPFRAKLDEVRRHLAFIHGECDARRRTAHPNLAERLQLLLRYLDLLAQRAADLDARLAAYRPAANPALDTWKQLFAELSGLATAAQALRTRQLPIYLAAAPDDHFLSNVVDALLQEVGVAGVRPVAVLHQDEWFAVSPAPPSHPLFYLPASITADPSELPLLLHEIGHVLFRLWDPLFRQRIADVVTATLDRKRREARNQADPAIARARAGDVAQWERQAYDEMEEIVCDVVGTLLGGPAFATALTIGLLAVSASPFLHHPPGAPYPPLDCRMRLGGLVLRRRGLDDRTLDALEDGWARVRALYTFTQPTAYGWLYDDRYLGDLIAAVEAQLLDEGLQLYAPGCGGLREQLAAGLQAFLDQDPAHRTWVVDTLAALRRAHDPSPP